mmetsp:Transcript_13986/g.16090  ORF Transcript_13986/g.16090 Transcript_13986/m.16090 type:complete len:371 (-) Transcript_13986:12-1124(-)
MHRPTLIDTDPGLDDAVGLLMALKSSEITVCAITTVAGNGSLTNMAANALRILKTVPGSKVPIYKGADRPLLGKIYKSIPDASDFHGPDGFGGFQEVYPPRMSDDEVNKACQDQHAALAIIDYSKKYPNELELLFIGPLTNLALALRIDPLLPKRVKKLTIMGGNHLGLGNVTACGEYNFAKDPEAAYIVLEEFSRELSEEISIIGWECAINTAPSPDDFNKEIALQKSGEFKDFYDHVLDRFLGEGSAQKKYQPDDELFKTDVNYESCVKGHTDVVAKNKASCYACICDAVAVAASIDSSVVSDSEHFPCTVELDGLRTRGQLIVARSTYICCPDQKDYFGKMKPLQIVLKLDQEKYCNMLQSAFEDKK